MDLTHINATEYEFSAEELGQLLLQSVKQAKSGEIANVRHIAVNQAVEARKKTGMSQADFANTLGISIRTLQGWEQGRRTPSGPAATLLKIAVKHPETLLELTT